MNPKKLVIAVIIGGLFIWWINIELGRRDSQMSSQNKFLSDIQKELKKYQDKDKKDKEKIKVIYDYAVAAVDIKKGEIIEVEQVNLKQYKAKQADGFTDVKKIFGKLSFKDIPKGSLIKTTYIGEDTTYKIPNGMRAINVPIKQIEGFNSLVHKHKRIDIVTATKDSEVILENVMVVAINKDKGNRRVESITLEIPAYASAKLIQAINTGKIHFVIRGKNDTKRIKAPRKKVSVESKNLPTLPTTTTPMPSISSENHTMTLLLGTEKKEITYE